MKEEILTDTLLRQYLLGKVDDEERERIEKLFLTDSQARDRVLSAEQDLIEDYLEDSLTTEDKAIFLSHYAQTPEQQRKLRINKSIKDWALTEAQADPVSPSIWTRFIEALRVRPTFIVPIAAAILVAIVIAAIWFTNRREHWAIQKELAELNTPASLSQNPPHMIALQLTPVTVRSGETPNQLTKRADTRTIEFILSIGRQQYSTYRVVVRRVEDQNLVATVDVPAKTGNPIRVRLPADQLTRGSYRLELSGIAPDESVGPAEEYTFVVDD